MSNFVQTATAKKRMRVLGCWGTEGVPCRNRISSGNTPRRRSASTKRKIAWCVNRQQWLLQVPLREARACGRNDPFAGALLVRDTLCRGVCRKRCGHMLCGVHRLVTILGHPLRIVSELGETSFEPLKFLHLVGIVRYSHQFGIFARLGAILLGSEHRQAFL